MPVTDPIADLLTRIRNAQHARNPACRAPWSRHKQEICELLKREGYLGNVCIEGEGTDKELLLEFAEGRLRLTLRRVSKPGRRIYRGKSVLAPVLRGLGIAILSTNKGLMTDREARKRGLGGEVLCIVS